MEGLKYLTCDEMDKPWELFYKWSELTMRKRGVNPKAWKQCQRRWVKDNKQRRKKCDKYFPTISIVEGKAKFKEIIEKIRKVGYYGVYYPKA